MSLETRHRRPPHARFGVFTREETQCLAFVGSELVDGGGADAGSACFHRG